MKLDNNKRIKVKMKNIKKLCFLTLMSTVFSLSLGSCTKKDKKAESPAKEQTTNEHPTDNKSSSEHPEHPADKKSSSEHPEHPADKKSSSEHPEHPTDNKSSSEHPSDDN
jgi:type IV secretory pathway VirB10-like protein